MFKNRLLPFLVPVIFLYDESDSGDGGQASAGSTNEGDSQSSSNDDQGNADQASSSGDKYANMSKEEAISRLKETTSESIGRKQKIKELTAEKAELEQKVNEASDADKIASGKFKELFEEKSGQLLEANQTISQLQEENKQWQEFQTTRREEIKSSMGDLYDPAFDSIPLTSLENIHKKVSGKNSNSEEFNTDGGGAGSRIDKQQRWESLYERSRKGEALSPKEQKEMITLANELRKLKKE